MLRRTLLALTLSLLSAHAQPPIYVAVGDGGRRLSTSDPTRWIDDQRWPDPTRTDPLFDVRFGLERFVAVGGDASHGTILSTSDGQHWQVLARLPSQLRTLAYGAGKFLVPFDGQLLISVDGEHFTPGAQLPIPAQFHRCVFGSGEAGPRFVLIGETLAPENKPLRVATEDGTTFLHLLQDAAPARDLAYGSGHFVLVGPKGLVESSHDGQNWLTHPTDPNAQFEQVVWTGQRFLALSASQTWSSEDALNWRQLPTPIAGRLLWASESDSLLWDSQLLFSSDLKSWTPLPIPPGPPLRSIAKRP